MAEEELHVVAEALATHACQDSDAAAHELLHALGVEEPQTAQTEAAEELLRALGTQEPDPTATEQQLELAAGALARHLMSDAVEQDVKDGANATVVMQDLDFEAVKADIKAVAKALLTHVAFTSSTEDELNKGFSMRGEATPFRVSSNPVQLLKLHAALRAELMEGIRAADPVRMRCAVNRGASLSAHYYSARMPARPGALHGSSKGPKESLVNPVEWACSTLQVVRMAERCQQAVVVACVRGQVKLLRELLQRGHEKRISQEAAALLLERGAWSLENRKEEVLKHAEAHRLQCIIDAAGLAAQQENALDPKLPEFHEVIQVLSSAKEEDRALTWAEIEERSVLAARARPTTLPGYVPESAEGVPWGPLHTVAEARRAQKELLGQLSKAIRKSDVIGVQVLVQRGAPMEERSLFSPPERTEKVECATDQGSWSDGGDDHFLPQDDHPWPCHSIYSCGRLKVKAGCSMWRLRPQHRRFQKDVALLLQDKLTFILLDQSLQSSMAGDVNIFFGQGDDPEKLYELGEIEVMVAAPESRRKGIAREAVQLMQAFAAQFLGTKQFLAKIKDENVASQKLFESLGYVLEKHVEVFQEIHYRFHVNREDLTPIVTEELQEDHDLVSATFCPPQYLGQVQVPHFANTKAPACKLSVRVLSASLPGLSAPGSFTRSRPFLQLNLGSAQKEINETEPADYNPNSSRSEKAAGTEYPWRFDEMFTFTVTTEDLTSPGLKLRLRVISDTQLGFFQFSGRPADVVQATIDLQKKVLPSCLQQTLKSDKRRCVWCSPIVPVPLNHMKGGLLGAECKLGEAVAHVTLLFSLDTDPDYLLDLIRPSAVALKQKLWDGGLTRCHASLTACHQPRPVVASQSVVTLTP
eukprot:g30503.t1